MKSMVYITNGGPIYARVIEHEDWHCPRDAYGRTDRAIHDDHIHQLHVVGIIRPDMTVHQKINRRAEFISQTAWHVWHRQVLPPGQYGRNWGRDYQWFTTPERIAKSRFRNAKHLRRRGIHPHGYSCIDFSFGLIGRSSLFSLTDTEQRHIHHRLELAASSRAPLPTWHLSDCWKKAA